MTPSNSNTHQYRRTFFLSRTNATLFHTFNNHKHTVAVIINIVVYLDSIISGYDYDFILHLTPLAEFQYKRTICSSRANIIPFHTFNKHKSTVTVGIIMHCSAFGQHARMTYDRILHRAPINLSNSGTHQNKRTACSSIANKRSFHKFNKHNKNTAAVDISEWDYDLILHRTTMTVSNSSTNQEIQTHHLFVQGQNDTVPCIQRASTHSRRRQFCVIVFIWTDRSIHSTNINTKPSSPL